MWADAHAARRCRLRRPAVAAALELPTLFSKSKSNAQSRLRQQVATERSDSDALRAEGASALSAVFLNQFSVYPMKHNLGAKPAFAIY